MKSLFPYQILLGSKSPRRSYLLEESGFNFVVKTIDVDESFSDTMNKEKVAEYIANKKADAYKSLLGENQIGLVADTVVYMDGDILEKPTDVEDAFQMLRRMSGEMHIVFTGVSIFNHKKQVSFTGRSEVKFLDLSDEEIHYYIEHYKPFDKAGSYGIQEWIGFTKIEKIDGSYSNIMGLPMELVYANLFQFIQND